MGTYRIEESTTSWRLRLGDAALQRKKVDISLNEDSRGTQMRADAEHTHAHLVRVAKNLFESDGAEVSYTRLAHEAHVGIGGTVDLSV